jgi:glycosyltransferase involved in cell wall biosynthesis
MQSQVYILIRSWKCFPYLEHSLSSVVGQKDKRFTVLFVDDCSDYTQVQKKYIRTMLAGHIVRFNTTRKYAARNAYEMIHKYAKNDNDIIINVDGDDWLPRNDVISMVKKIYASTNCMLTYGNCEYYHPGYADHGRLASADGQLNHRYPSVIERANAYRKTFFIPLHLRTWKAGLFKKINKESFLRPDGAWTRSCEDQAMFLPMLEIAGGKYQVLHQSLYVYNRQNIYNEAKTNREDLFFDELCLYKKQPYNSLP